MLDLREELAELHLRRMKDVFHRVDRHERHAQLLCARRDFGLVLILHPARDLCAAAIDALRREMKLEPTLRILPHPCRLTHQGPHAVPVSGLGHPKVDIPVAALKERRRSAEIVGLSPGADLHGSRHHLAENVVDQAGHRCLLRNVDELSAAGALPPVQAGGNGERRSEARLVVRKETAHPGERRLRRICLGRGNDIPSCCAAHSRCARSAARAAPRSRMA